MREALLKNILGIPAALLLVLLLSGTALAWYSINTISSGTTVEESISTANEAEFSATMYPGETNTWTFDIVNSADVSYSIKADLTQNVPNGVSITAFTVDGADEFGDLMDDGSAEFDIDASGIKCSMTISSANDAATGNVSVSLALSRA